VLLHNTGAALVRQQWAPRSRIRAAARIPCRSSACHPPALPLPCLPHLPASASGPAAAGGFCSAGGPCPCGHVPHHPGHVAANLFGAGGRWGGG
jgi:hypothetical protein